MERIPKAPSTDANHTVYIHIHIMLACCLCEGTVLSLVIVACDVGICEFDFVLLLSTWKTSLLLSLWLRLLAKFVQFCVCCCFHG